MFSAGSNVFETPKRCAVDGINCISPRAPLLEISRGLKSDSALMTADTSAASTSNFFAASTMILSYFVLKIGPLVALYRHERWGKTPPSSTIFFTSATISGVAISSSMMRSTRPRDVRVDLRRRDVRMSEHHLHAAQIGAVLEQMRRE